MSDDISNFVVRDDNNTRRIKLADFLGGGAGSIADGAVITAKLADGAVTAQKVAADVATQAELDAHTNNTTNPHGVTLANLATTAGVTSAVATHEADTTAVHGIANTADLVTSATIDNIVQLTQAAYDALGTPNATTLYIVVG